jgi:release factor glutamine methyltransferase
MEVRSNRIGDIRNYYRTKLLVNYEEKEADNLLFMLIEEYSGISKARIFSEPDLTISESELLKIHFAIKDLNNHKPIQYILGKTEFYGLPMIVNPQVLIPRPETEELVEWIISENKDSKKINILDIGTGSGCIAIALKKNLHQAIVTAIDVSVNAIEVAKKNGLVNQTDILFKTTDILNEQYLLQFATYDIIVSNPPYVRKSEIKEIKRNIIDYEPRNALFVDDKNPLIFYQAIAEFARDHLSKKGKIYCEINQYLGPEISELFKKNGFIYTEVRKDLFGNDRMIRACLFK